MKSRKPKNWGADSKLRTCPHCNTDKILIPCSDSRVGKDMHDRKAKFVSLCPSCRALVVNIKLSKKQEKLRDAIMSGDYGTIINIIGPPREGKTFGVLYAFAVTGEYLPGDKARLGGVSLDQIYSLYKDLRGFFHKSELIRDQVNSKNGGIMQLNNGFEYHFNSVTKDGELKGRQYAMQFYTEVSVIIATKMDFITESRNRTGLEEFNKTNDINFVGALVWDSNTVSDDSSIEGYENYNTEIYEKSNIVIDSHEPYLAGPNVNVEQVTFHFHKGENETISDRHRKRMESGLNDYQKLVKYGSRPSVSSNMVFNQHPEQFAQYWHENLGYTPNRPWVLGGDPGIADEFGVIFGVVNDDYTIDVFSEIYESRMSNKQAHDRMQGVMSKYDIADELCMFKAVDFAINKTESDGTKVVDKWANQFGWFWDMPKAYFKADRMTHLKDLLDSGRLRLSVNLVNLFNETSKYKKVLNKRTGQREYVDGTDHLVSALSFMTTMIPIDDDEWRFMVDNFCTNKKIGQKVYNYTEKSSTRSRMIESSKKPINLGSVKIIKKRGGINRI